LRICVVQGRPQARQAAARPSGSASSGTCSEKGATTPCTPPLPVFAAELVGPMYGPPGTSVAIVSNSSTGHTRGAPEQRIPASAAAALILIVSLAE